MSNNIVTFPNRAGPARRIVPGRLRNARIAKGFNQTELAGAVGVSRQAISVFESGDKGPNPETMTRIAEALEQPLSFFSAKRMLSRF